MNDCVWCFIGVCECDEYRCAKYLSIDSEEGRKIEEAYDAEIQAVLKPVKDKFRAEMEALGNEYCSEGKS